MLPKCFANKGYIKFVIIKINAPPSFGMGTERGDMRERPMQKLPTNFYETGDVKVFNTRNPEKNSKIKILKTYKYIIKIL